MEQHSLSPSRPLRVLYVEDSDLDAEIFEDMARDVDSEDVYVRAADGKEALGLLPEKDFDLILLDLNLPGAHGFEVLAAARKSQHHRRTPVIVFSASASTVDVDRAYDNGANAYVVKPSDASAQRMFILGLRMFWSQVRT